MSARHATHALSALVLGVALIATPHIGVAADTAVSVTASHTYKSHLQGDSVERRNSLEWEGMWALGIYNWSEYTVTNPRVVLDSTLSFSDFTPSDPEVFTADPTAGRYTWDLTGIDIGPGMTQPFYAMEVGDRYTERSPYTVRREVFPLVLAGDVTTQTVNVIFRLDRPLPAGTARVSINIGDTTWAYGHEALMDQTVVDQTCAPGWNADFFPDMSQVSWHVDHADVEIGRTYDFQAVLLQHKRGLLGSPTYKPQVEVHHGGMNEDLGIVAGTQASVTLGAITGTFHSDNSILWRVQREPLPYHIFHLMTETSQMTPPPAPFHVLIDADCTIRVGSLTRGSEIFTAAISLPVGYDPASVVLSTVECEGAQAIAGAVKRGTYVATFNKADLIGVEPGVRMMVATGELADGTRFRAADTVRIRP